LEAKVKFFQVLFGVVLLAAQLGHSPAWAGKDCKGLLGGASADNGIAILKLGLERQMLTANQVRDWLDNVEVQKPQSVVQGLNFLKDGDPKRLAVYQALNLWLKNGQINWPDFRAKADVLLAANNAEKGVRTKVETQTKKIFAPHLTSKKMQALPPNDWLIQGQATDVKSLYLIKRKMSRAGISLEVSSLVGQRKVKRELVLEVESELRHWNLDVDQHLPFFLPLVGGREILAVPVPRPGNKDTVVQLFDLTESKSNKVKPFKKFELPQYDADRGDEPYISAVRKRDGSLVWICWISTSGSVKKDAVFIASSDTGHNYIEVPIKVPTESLSQLSAYERIRWTLLESPNGIEFLMGHPDNLARGDWHWFGVRPFQINLKAPEKGLHFLDRNGTTVLHPVHVENSNLSVFKGPGSGKVPSFTLHRAQVTDQGLKVNRQSVGKFKYVRGQLPTVTAPDGSRTLVLHLVADEDDNVELQISDVADPEYKFTLSIPDHFVAAASGESSFSAHWIKDEQGAEVLLLVEKESQKALRIKLYK